MRARNISNQIISKNYGPNDFRNISEAECILMVDLILPNDAHIFEQKRKAKSFTFGARISNNSYSERETEKLEKRKKKVFSHRFGRQSTHTLIFCKKQKTKKNVTFVTISIFSQCLEVL